ncbi:MAG: IS110 family transposase [Bacteroidota bacterium]
MEFTFMVGIDMGKAEFAYCVMDHNFRIHAQGQIANQTDAIDLFCQQLVAQLRVGHIGELFLCVEHTGSYNQPLIRHWIGLGGRLDVIPATKVSQLLAGPQGWSDKNDSIDARRLAEFGVRFSDKLTEHQLPSKTLKTLRIFHHQRDRLIKARISIEATFKEAQHFEDPQLIQQASNMQAELVSQIKRTIKKIDQQLLQIIKQDPQLRQWFQLMTSVEGVGPVIAREILIATHGFTKFKPNQAKQFARYAGVVPLEWSSGSSLKKRKRTSKKAYQHLKPLLTVGATSLIKTSNQLAQYYERKLREGKKHLWIINAMRNKIILRVFAVVRNQTMYQKNLNLNLVEP